MGGQAVTVDHDEHHRSIEVWCNEASDLFMRLAEQLAAIDHRLANIEARVSEWEVGPR